MTEVEELRADLKECESEREHLFQCLQDATAKLAKAQAEIAKLALYGTPPGETRDRAERAEAKLAKVVEALDRLMSFQNGPPLPSYEKGWHEAMKLSAKALKEAQK